MENTWKMTQPIPAAPVLVAAQAREELMDKPQALPAPVPPQAVALPPPEGPQMQDVAAEEEQASLAQDESSDSSASGEWVEPEDPHPPGKRARRLSPDYDPAEELPKTYERQRKKTRH